MKKNLGGPSLGAGDPKGWVVRNRSMHAICVKCQQIADNSWTENQYTCSSYDFCKSAFRESKKEYTLSLLHPLNTNTAEFVAFLRTVSMSKDSKQVYLVGTLIDANNDKKTLHIDAPFIVFGW